MYFKLVVLFAMVASAISAPSGVVLLGQQPILTQTVVGSVPATISSHSSQVVHSAALAAPSVQVIGQHGLALAGHGLVGPSVQVVQAAQPSVAVVPSVQHSAIIGSVPSTISAHSSQVVHSAAIVQPHATLVGVHGW